MSGLDIFLSEETSNHAGCFPGKSNAMLPKVNTSFVFDKYGFQGRATDIPVNDLERKSYEAIPVQTAGFTIFPDGF